MLLGKKYQPLDFALLLWRRRRFVIVPTIAVFFAALVFSSRLPNQWQSEMLIQVVPQRVPDSFVQSTVTIRTEDRLNALQQQVTSRTELERVIKEYDLYPNERKRLPMQDVVEHMSDQIVVDPVRSATRQQTDAFYIRYTYTNPETATRVTERLGNMFIDQNARDRGVLADAASDFLQKQLVEAKARLEEQEAKLEQFRNTHAGRLPSQLEFNMNAIQSVQMQLQGIVEGLARDRDTKQTRERLYQDALTDPVAVAPVAVPGAPGQPDVLAGTAQQRLAAARTRLAADELRLRPEHPDIIRSRRQISELEQLVARETADAAASGAPAAVTTTPEQSTRRQRLQQMRAEIESIDRQIAFREAEERRLRAQIAEYQARVEAVPGTESEWIRLTRDYDTQQAVYRRLLDRAEQARVSADMERRQVGEQFRVLDAARVPLRPSRPVRVLISAGGLALGFLLGLAIVIVRELRDSTFRTGAEVVELFSLPVVALVPYIESDQDRAWIRRRRLLTSVAMGVGAVAGGVMFWSMQLWRYVV